MPRRTESTPASAHRDQLITENLGLVHHVARAMLRRLSNDASLDDLVSAGMLGLVTAAENFDDSRGLTFSTYALPRIRGAILDDLRAMDRAPRSVRQKARTLRAARDTVTQRNASPADSRDIAQELGVNVETVWEWDADLNATNEVSLDATTQFGDDDRPFTWQLAADDEAPDEGVARLESIDGLQAALAKMPERERNLLALYYYEELTQKQIAQVLGVTESRVSQLRVQAIIRLRKLMGARPALVA